MRIFSLLILIVIFTGCTAGRGLQSGRSGGGNRIVNTAERYIGVNYRRGGISPAGFDCSGLVMYVYKKHGIVLPRTALQQFRAGKRINSKNAEPGDLLFFRTAGRRINHVGIYAGKGRFIHAPSSGKKVSFAMVDNPYWRKKYAGAVSYLR
jgi:cell wall-associated NlpC family hydrolase